MQIRDSRLLQLLGRTGSSAIPLLTEQPPPVLRDAYLPFVEAISAANELLPLDRPVLDYRRPIQVGVPTAGEIDDLLERASRLNPLDGCIWLDRGWLAAVEGNANEALTFMRQAADVSRDDYSAYVSIGLMVERRSSSAALTAYSKAVAYEPNLLDSQWFLDLQNRDKALSSASIEQAVSLLQSRSVSPSPIIEAKLARLMLQEGKLTNARHLAEDALKKLPNLAGAWVTLARYQESTGRSDEALSSYKKASFLVENDHVPLYRVGQLLLAKGQTMEGLNDLRLAADMRSKLQTEHSKRVWMMYRPRIALANDLLPRRLLSYISPLPTAASILDEISGVYRKRGDAVNAEHFKTLSMQATY